MVLDAIRDGFDDYTRDLPKNISKSAMSSALYSFVISALLSGDVHVGLATAALAATVSTISGLTMPFFRRAFADRYGDIKWHHQAASMVVNLAITQLLVNTFTFHRINLIAGAFFTIGLNLALNGLKDQSTRDTPVYIMV